MRPHYYYMSIGNTRARTPAESNPKLKPHGLCDCFTDSGVCCCSICCGCVLLGKTYQYNKSPEEFPKWDDSFGLPCIGYMLLDWVGASSCASCYSQSIVSKARVKQGLPGSSDVGIVAKACCCMPCVTAQDYMDCRDGVVDRPTAVNSM